MRKRHRSAYFASPCCCDDKALLQGGKPPVDSSGHWKLDIETIDRLLDTGAAASSLSDQLL